MSNRTHTSVATPQKTHWESWLWQRCLAPKTSLVLFVLLVLGLLVGQLVPQRPDDVLADPAAYERWVQAIPEPFGRVQTILSRLGLFNVQRSVWFVALLALAATLSMVALVNHLDTLWRPQNVPLHQLSSVDRDKAVAVPNEIVEAVVRVVDSLVGPARQVTENGRTTVYGSRPRWVPPLTLLAWVGLLVSVVGAVVGMRWGWTISAMALPPQAIIHVTSAQALSLLSFDRWRSQAVLQIERGARRMQITTTADRPAFAGGLRAQVIDTAGLYVQVRAFDRDGRPLELYPYAGNAEPAWSLSRVFPADTGPTDQEDWVLFVPSRDLVVQLRRIDRDNWRVVFSNNAGQVLAEQSRTSGTVEINGTSLHLETTFYPTLMLSYRPGRTVILLGALLVIIGGIFSIWPVQRLWVEVMGETERIVVRVRQASLPGEAKEHVQIALQTAGVLPSSYSTEKA